MHRDERATAGPLFRMWVAYGKHPSDTSLLIFLILRARVIAAQEAVEASSGALCGYSCRFVLQVYLLQVHGYTVVAKDTSNFL